jgi:hypothetical protein
MSVLYILCEFGTAISKRYACFCCLFKIIMSGLLCLRMNWSNIEKWRNLLKIGTIVLSSILKYCAKFKKKLIEEFLSYYLLKFRDILHVFL